MQEEAESSAPYSVLVVDDEREILDLIVEICSDSGWAMKACSSPVEALEMTRRERFDLLVLDLYMPELPGMLLHSKLKFIDPELAERTLFITGHFSREELRRDLEEAGKILLKPFRPQELIAKVTRLLPVAPRKSRGRPAAESAPV